MSKKVLLSGGPETIKIARKLHEDGLELYTVMPNVAQDLKALDLPVKSLADIATTPLMEEARLSAALILKDVARMEFVQDGLHPNVHKWLNTALPLWSTEHLSDLALLVITLDELHPDIVVVHNDTEPILRTVSMWARERKVPCLHVPHSIYINSEGVGKPGTDIHDIVTSSHICVAGHYQAQWYVQRGVKKEQLLVTGLPQFDHWYTIKTNRQLAIDLLNIDPDLPTIVFAGTWNQGTNLRGLEDRTLPFYEAFLEAIKDQPWNIIIKTHPRGNNDDFHLKLARDANVRCLVTGQYLELALQVGDVLLSQGPSNVIIEAALMNLPSIVNEGFENDKAVTKTACDSTTIRHDIAEVLTHKDQWAIDRGLFIQNYLTFCDGDSLLRVVTAIEELSELVPVEVSNG